MRTIALLAVAVLALAGCGQDAPSSGPAAAPAETAAVKAPGVDTAADLVAALSTRVKTAKLSVAYTEESDPNDKLGRPGGYVSKAAFVDSRIDAGDVLGEKGDVQFGGGVEVFTDPVDAQARKAYVEETLEAAQVFGSEYMAVAGGALLRVSGELTPKQWRAYERAWPGVVVEVLG
jgi:hypothetical protein